MIDKKEKKILERCLVHVRTDIDAKNYLKALKKVDFLLNFLRWASE